jgi:subtilisin-like proprotein convertase family protein
MKKITILFAIISALNAGAQSFTAAGNAVTDNNTEVCFPVTVSGLPTQISSSFGLSQVCLNMTHTYVGDLKFRLKSPNGTIVLMINNNGGSGDNFTNTCLTNSSTVSINAGSAPFAGNFIPFQSLNIQNNGQNPNGIWYLCVIDEVPGDAGVVQNFTITFSNNPPADPVIVSGPCGISNGLACQCPDGTQDCDLLPDMTASAVIMASQHTETPGLIRLSNATPNIGWGPMEIHGSTSCKCGSNTVPCTTAICPDGSYPKQQLKQTIYHKNGATITARDTLTPGEMSYHPTHGHVHVDDWAVFSLRKPTSNPDATTWPIVAQGAKISFCLINLGNCTSNPGYCRDGNYGTNLTMADIPNSPFGVVSGCSTDQGIYVGNLDIYSQGLAGMDMDLTGVCNGNYYIVSITDPHNNFIESNETNNWAATPITLTQQQPAPVAAFTYTATANQVQFSNPPNINLTYDWYFGDGGTSNNQNPIHTYSSSGTYFVTLIISGNCGNDTLTQPLVILTSDIAQNLTTDLGYVAYPNPTNKNITLSYLVPQKSEVKFDVFDMIGNLVYTINKGTQDYGRYEANLNLNELGLSKGVYNIRMTASEKQASVKVVLIE